jgi:hypothetical protein
MFYRESGEFKTSYAKDNSSFPITADKFIHVAMLVIALSGRAFHDQ